LLKKLEDKELSISIMGLGHISLGVGIDIQRGIGTAIGPEALITYCNLLRDAINDIEARLGFSKEGDE
jgi:hypothetical protein